MVHGMKTAREWKEHFAREQSATGMKGLHACLERAMEVELPEGGALVFPHTRLGRAPGTRWERGTDPSGRGARFDGLRPGDGGLTNDGLTGVQFNVKATQADVSRVDLRLIRFAT